MGVGGFGWGALSDRFGTRAVVLTGGVLLGIGLVTASQASTLGQFQLFFGVLVGLAAGSFYAPLTSTTTKWFTPNRSLAVALVSAGLGLGATVMGPLARWIITSYDWRVAMLVIGNLAWLVIIPAALLVREPRGAARRRRAGGGRRRRGREFTAAQAFRTPQFAAIALTHFACCAAHSGPIFHMVTNAMDHGITAMAAATVFSVAGVGSLTGKIVCGLVADRIGAKRMLLIGLALQALRISLYTVIGELARLLRPRAPVRLLLWRRDAALRHRGARVLRGPDHGDRVRRGRLRGHAGHGAGPRRGRLALRHLRQLLLALHGLAGIGLGAVAIAITFRPPRPLALGLPAPTAAG